MKNYYIRTGFLIINKYDSQNQKFLEKKEIEFMKIFFKVRRSTKKLSSKKIEIQNRKLIHFFFWKFIVFQTMLKYNNNMKIKNHFQRNKLLKNKNLEIITEKKKFSDDEIESESESRENFEEEIIYKKQEKNQCHYFINSLENSQSSYKLKNDNITNFENKVKIKKIENIIEKTQTLKEGI